MAQRESTCLPISRHTRDEVIRPLKRGGETYDELLRRMADQYEPREPNTDE